MLREKATLAPLRTGRGDKLSAPILICECSLWGRSGLPYLDERRDSQPLPLGSPMVRRDDVLGAAEEIDRIDEIDDWKKNDSGNLKSRTCADDQSQANPGQGWRIGGVR